jgi:hypothetical protein
MEAGKRWESEDSEEAIDEEIRKILLLKQGEPDCESKSWK